MNKARKDINLEVGNHAPVGEWETKKRLANWRALTLPTSKYKRRKRTKEVDEWAHFTVDKVEAFASR